MNLMLKESGKQLVYRVLLDDLKTCGFPNDMIFKADDFIVKVISDQNIRLNILSNGWVIEVFSQALPDALN